MNPVLRAVPMVNFRPSEGLLGLGLDSDFDEKCEFVTSLHIIEHIHATKCCAGKPFHVAHRGAG